MHVTHGKWTDRDNLEDLRGSSIDRQDRSSIFDKLARDQNSRLQGTLANQEIQWQKEQNRKHREKLNEKIKEMQSKIKAKKRDIEK